ncbi:hypothetical protein M1494_00355 [Candidatus Parvarchaeota archaeon]|nr:hypothetical protein [Candidatus Parvarchaeota archaeon]
MAEESKDLDSMLGGSKTLISKLPPKLKDTRYASLYSPPKSSHYDHMILYDNMGPRRNPVIDIYTNINVLKDLPPDRDWVEVLNQYTHEKEIVRLTRRQRIAVALGLPVKESIRQYKGWDKEGLPFYVFKYRDNNKTFLMLDYQHDYRGKFNTDFLG